MYCLICPYEKYAQYVTSFTGVLSDFGNSPGHYAAEGGRPECLNCFLQHDGEIDVQNIKGDTPLDTARKFGHPLLMEKGGNTALVLPQ